MTSREKNSSAENSFIQKTKCVKYDDIISLPHHVSSTRRHMSIRDRAAQFSAFAALSGYDDEIKETARLTDGRRKLDETELEELSMKLAMILELAAENPYITVTFFAPDSKKSGGVYKTVTGNLKKVDELERTLTITDGTVINLDDITDIESVDPDV